MGYSLFSNDHFQMGVTVMGFAEDFGQDHPGQSNFCSEKKSSEVKMSFTIQFTSNHELSILGLFQR